MSVEAKTEIVDFILQRAISDIDTTSNDVREKLITLECGHVFTVKTLDGHCSMSDYYEIDLMTDRYLQMKAPPIEYQMPPTCPTCRGPITSPRYGRVAKRANLDILEQNVANGMSKRLKIHGRSLEDFAARLDVSEIDAKAIVKGNDFASEDAFTKICKRRKGSFGEPDLPLPVHMLTGMQDLHGFSKREANAWQEIVKEINRLYGAIAGVASVRSAHVKAYKADMTTLLKLEMEAIALDPSKLNGKTQYEAALEAANAKVGQPPHHADQYHIEAFLLSIALRLILARIASARVSELPLISNSDDSRHRQIWTTFVSFLYDSCIEDCAKASVLARSCSALKQEVRVGLGDLRCAFEKARFDVLEGHRKILDRSGKDQTFMRATLCTRILEQKAAASETLLQVRTKYFQNRPINSQEVLWFNENCSFRADKIIAAYQDLREQVLKADVFHQSMTLQEKQDWYAL